MPEGKFIAYYRVSTSDPSLRLQAQQIAVRNHLNGGTWDLLSEMVEIETGRKNDRTMLAQALRQCRLFGATLLIAKLDRLSQDADFMLALMEAKVDFVAVDFPDANRLTVHIIAAVAEHERQLVSQRTRKALAEAKAKEVKLGDDGSNLLPVVHIGSQKAALKRKAEAFLRAAELIPQIRELQSQGLSLHAIARRFQEASLKTPRGGKWTATQISNVLKKEPTK